MGFLPMILIFVAFYFLLIRPQRQKEKKLKNMIAALEKGAKVKTAHTGREGEAYLVLNARAAIDLGTGANDPQVSRANDTHSSSHLESIS